MWNQSRFLGKGARYALIGVTLVFVLFPVYWMITTSIKPPLEYATRQPTWFPKQPTLDHYRSIFQQEAYRYFLNTVKVATAATAVSLVVGLMAAYSLTRFRFPARLDLIFLMWVLLVRMAPPVVIAIPMYTTLRSIGLLDSHLGLILAYQIYTLPYCIWMLLGFVRDVPIAVEEAASIDGATTLRIIRSIVLPLVGPGLVATAIFGIIMTWNEFIYALLYLRTPSAFTLPIHIANYITEYEVLWGGLMGIGLLSSLPILLLSGYVQKYLLRGFSMGLK